MQAFGSAKDCGEPCGAGLARVPKHCAEAAPQPIVCGGRPDRRREAAHTWSCRLIGDGLSLNWQTIAVDNSPYHHRSGGD